MRPYQGIFETLLGKALATRNETCALVEGLRSVLVSKLPYKRCV